MAEIKAGDKIGHRTILEIGLIKNNKPASKVSCECGRVDILLNHNIANCAFQLCRTCSNTKNKTLVSIGDIIGDRTIIDPFILKNGKRYCSVKCKCGREDVVGWQALLKGRSNSCTECAKSQQPKELENGDRFKAWTVIDANCSFRDNGKSGKSLLQSLCRCDCGTEKLVDNWILRRGRSYHCDNCFNVYKSLDDFTSNKYAPAGYTGRQSKSARRKKRSLESNYDIDIELDKQDNICPLSGFVLIKTRHKEGKSGCCTTGPCNISDDRIDSNGPYSQENIRALFKPINMMRSNYSDKLLIELCTMVHNHTKDKNYEFDENGNIKKECYDTSLRTILNRPREELCEASH